jgi:hypothetical protein
MNDQNEVRQCLIVVRILILPTLFEEIVQFIPLLKLKNCFKLELDDLKMLRDDVSLSGAIELFNALCCSSPKVLAMLASLEVILQLYASIKSMQFSQ